MTKFEYEDCADLVAAIARKNNVSIPMPAFEQLERGGIVGKANLVDCVIDSDSLWFAGKFGFMLENAAPMPFTPYKGQLGFFDVPNELLRAA